MTRRSLLNGLAVTALALAFTAHHANAQLARDVVGTWTLVSAGEMPMNPIQRAPRFSKPMAVLV
jgi:hypothetical protein